MFLKFNLFVRSLVVIFTLMHSLITFAQNSGGLAPLIKKNPIRSTQNDVQNGEARENLKVCLDGRYPSLCKHGSLSYEQKNQVLKSELRENLKTCLDGRYPSLCKHDLLLQEEYAKVNLAEKRENRKICLDGRYPSLCNRSLLD